MVFTSLSFVQPTSAPAVLEAGEIRALIAKQLDVDIRRVTDEAHFNHDLGADWLDRLEVLTLIEDLFVDVEITDEDADQIEVVGDLIRYIEDARGCALSR
jgi:acyl carrier protein